MSTTLRCVTSLFVLAGLMLSGCQSPYSVTQDKHYRPSTDNDENTAVAVLYTETFDNSVTLEFLEDNEGALSYAIRCSMDQMNDLAGYKQSVLNSNASASEIYTAMKKYSFSNDDFVRVPDEVLAIDKKILSLPPLPLSNDNSVEEFYEVEKAKPDGFAKTQAILHGEADDNYFLAWFESSPGLSKAQYLSYYSVAVRKNAYHLDFTCFNSSSTYNATYQHWNYISSTNTPLLFSRSLQPREVYMHTYMRVLYKIHRKSKLTAGNSYVAHSIYFGLKWDPTPVSYATDESFHSIVHSRLVFVDFNTSWCSHCADFAPTFEAVSTQVTTHAFVNVDCGKCPETADEYNINQYPMIHAMQDGDIVGRYTGAYDSETAFKNWCNSMINQFD